MEGKKFLHVFPKCFKCSYDLIVEFSVFYNKYEYDAKLNFSPFHIQFSQVEQSLDAQLAS